MSLVVGGRAAEKSTNAAGARPAVDTDRRTEPARSSPKWRGPR